MGLSQAQSEGIRHQHHELAAPGGVSLCLLLAPTNSEQDAESCKLQEEEQISVLSPSLSFLFDEQRGSFSRKCFYNLIN